MQWCIMLHALVRDKASYLIWLAISKSYKTQKLVRGTASKRNRNIVNECQSDVMSTVKAKCEASLCLKKPPVFLYVNTYYV